MRDDPADYTHALRVTFAYDADSIALKHVRRVAMRVLAPTTPPPGEMASGHWLAVEDQAGKVIFHVPLHNPLGYDREAFPQDGGQARRVAATTQSGTFEVLVPDLAGGARLVLRGPQHGRAYGPTHGPEAHQRLARSRAFALASHSLAELRQHAAKVKE